MHIEIYADGSTAGTETHHFARTCAEFELGDYADQVAFVRVYIAGPRLAVDGRQPSCQVEVVFIGGEVVSERAVDNDLHIAIFWSLERTGGTIAHRTQYATGAPNVASISELLPVESTTNPYSDLDRIA